MRQTLTLFLSLLMLLSLIACSNTSPDISGLDTSKSTSENKNQESGSGHTTSPNDDTDTPEETPTTSNTETQSTSVDTPEETTTTGSAESQIKINDTIVASSVFSEGLAFVEYGSYPNTTYCINKDGNVIFKLDGTYSLLDKIKALFKGGIAIMDQSIVCDTEGNITHPEDVGATNFYDAAQHGGYILADVITSTFESSSQKMGVLNSSLQWIVEPNERIYELFYDDAIRAFNNSDFYTYDSNYLYYEGNALNLQTGEIITNATISSGNHITVSELENKYPTYYMSTDFSNGFAAIMFYNRTTRKYYISMVNESGDLLYEPVELDMQPKPYYDWEYNGTYIIITDSDRGAVTFRTYDMHGNLLGSHQIGMTNWTYQDGVLTVWRYNHGVTYYDIQLNPLF